MVGQFGYTVAEEEQAPAAGAHPFQDGSAVFLVAVQVGVGPVGQEHQLTFSDCLFTVPQLDLRRQTQIGREAQTGAGGRVHDGGDAVQMRAQQIGEAHQRVLVKTWKPTRFSRKP